MQKKIIQFRYYDNNNSNNYPASADSATKFITGQLFTSYMPGIHLGVQTIPGTKLYLNDNYTNPVIIGATGIYELSLEGTSGLLQNIKVDATSMDIIKNTRGAYIIMDLVYETEEN